MGEGDDAKFTTKFDKLQNLIDNEDAKRIKRKDEKDYEIGPSFANPNEDLDKMPME